MPANFNAVAGDGEVALGWSDLGIVDLERIVLMRRSGESAAETLAVLPPAATAWIDTGVVNGVTYGYRAGYVVEDDPGGRPSNEDRATPGSARVWIVDESWGGLWMISPDGRDRVWRLSYAGYLRSLDVDRTRGLVWTVSGFGDQLVSVDTAGSITGTIPVALPRAVAVDENDGSIWVAAGWGVGHYSATGALWFADSTVSEPKDIALDPVRGACWVAEGTGSVWVRYPDGGTVRVSGFDYPFSLSVVEEDGGCWLVDAGLRRVYRLEYGAAVRGSSGQLGQPVDVAAAPSGEAWVADWDGNAVIRLNAAAETVARIEGLDRPRGVAVSDSGNVIWVVEAMGGRVSRISAAGERLATVGGLDFPKAIAIVEN